MDESTKLEKSRNINLLTVGPYPPPYGGISSHIEELGRNTKALGISLTALRYASSSETTERPNAETTVRSRSSRNLGAFARTIIRRPLRVIKLLALLAKMGWESPRDHLSGAAKAIILSDTIHLDGNNMVALYGTGEGIAIPYLRTLHPEIPVLYWVFAAPYIDISQFRRVRRLYSAAVEGSDVLGASSQYCAGAVELLSPGQNREVNVVYFGVDSDRFSGTTSKQEARRHLDIDIKNNGKVILFLGRMESEMGTANALEIASTITSDHENVTFLICGARGSMTEQVEQLAERSNGRVQARVNVPFDDLPMLYAASDLVIAPTIGAHACMGVSVKEAMAVGRPVVVSNSGGLPEAIIDGQHGRIVSLDPQGAVDNKVFLAVITDLISSDETLETMGRACRQRFEDLFTTEQMIHKVKNTINDAATARARKIS